MLVELMEVEMTVVGMTVVELGIQNSVHHSLSR